MIKGCSHHVMPYNSGWCVMSEVNRRVIAHFATEENALAYAEQCAKGMEGSVLLHKTALEAGLPEDSDLLPTLSSVSLPQQDPMADFAHQELPHHQPGKPSSWEAKGDSADDLTASDYDPLLGYDEYYFEI